MPFDYRYKGLQRKTQKINVSPTLFIGLGGSGKETLMRLRRSFYTNMRETGLPIHEYLWIDTDPSRQDIRDQDYDDILSSLFLPETDIIDAQVPSNDINHYFNRPANYEYIFEWMHPSIQNLGPEMLQNGAGMVRPCGRLAFYHHFDTIRYAIQSKLKAVNKQARANRAIDMDYAVTRNTTNVFIICSNAGGTGAGMFIDTAFLLSWLSTNNHINLTTTGFIFLPSVFEPILSGEKLDALYSNGYASLMELDYYMSPKTGIQLDNNTYKRLNFKWDGSPHQVNAAPFHTLYLLGNTNNSDVAMDSSNYTNIFQMAADAIYLEYCNSQFGDEKRSVRVNHQDFLMNETRYLEYDSNNNTIYSQFYPNRYSSFGLSFIKLDIDRKRNAASYFLGQALIVFWSSSKSNPQRGAQDAEKALVVEIIEGDTMNPLSMQKYLLSRGPGSLLDSHVNRIREGFRNIRERLNHYFDHNLGLGLERADRNLKSLSKEIDREPDVHAWLHVVPAWNSEPERGDQGKIVDKEDLIATLSRVTKGWDDSVGIGIEMLSSGGQDADAINANTTFLLENIQSHFEDQFFEHLSKPGKDDGSGGIAQTEIFCEEYRTRIHRIIGELNEQPLKSCNFVLKPIKKSPDLLAILLNKRQADNIKAPLYRRTAKSCYDRQYTAGLRMHLDGVAQELTNKINQAERDLLDWFMTKYNNHVKKKAAHILKQVDVKIDKYLLDLEQYKIGLNALIEKQQALFNAYNVDHEDLRYHHIYQNTDDAWYKKEVRKALIPFYDQGGLGMDWNEFMVKETDKFFKDLLHVTDDADDEKRDERLRDKGFRELFDILANHKPYEMPWIDLNKLIEIFCFQKMKKFMANTNVDNEFRDSSVDKAQELANVCQAADIWIKASPLGIHPEKVDYIGAPPAERVTVNQVKANVIGFGGANDFPHEQGNLVFYRERVAFPLCYLWEIDEYYRRYSTMTANLHSLYKRHYDFNLINVLRSIKPPATQADAQNLFDVGLVVMEALALNCFGWDESNHNCSGNLRLKKHQAEGYQKIDLGSNLNNVIEILKAAPDWTDTVKEGIKKRQQNIDSHDGSGLLKIYKIIEYYKNKIYPTLNRAGFAGVSQYNTNGALLCEYLRKHYLNLIVAKNGYENDRDPKLWEKINAISLEEISEEISFREAEAQAPMRVLR